MTVKRPPPFDTYPPTKLWWNSLQGYAKVDTSNNDLRDCDIHNPLDRSHKIATRIEANGSYVNGLVVRLFNYKILDQKAIDIYKYLVNAAIPGINFRLYENFETKKSKLDDDIDPDHRESYCFSCVVVGNRKFCPSLLAHDSVERLIYTRKRMKSMRAKLWEI